MKAIILAAGYGRRMRPLTDHEHKALLEVNGRTVIGHIIDALLENGIRDIVVATGYLAERLETKLEQSYPEARFVFVENRSFATTNNIHSLSLVLNRISIDDDLLLIESDLIFEPSLIRKALADPRGNVALVARHRSGMDGTVVTISNQVITSIIPPHLQGPDFEFSDKFKTLNVYKFSQEFSEHVFKKLLDHYAAVIDQNAYYELVLGILIYVQRAVIHALLVDDEKWAEVDDPNDLEQARFTFCPEDRLEILRDACGGYWNFDVVDFTFIRNAHFPTSAILSELRRTVPSLISNYGSRQDVVDRKLAYFLLCEPGRVRLLNGCSQAFPLLRRFFRGRPALIPRPTFGEYARAFPKAAAYDDCVGIDPEEIEQKAAQAAAAVVVVVNPNNPTGSFVDSRSIFDFAARHPDKHVIVDESFIDFAPTRSLLPILEQRPLGNVTVLKSLSKSLGVPGLRLGFLWTANSALDALVRDELPIWNSNSLAESFLEIILKHRGSLEDSYRQTIRDREELAAELRSLPFVDHVYPSAANFLLTRFRGSSGELRGLPGWLLQEANVYVKDVSGRFADERFYLRLSVRLPEENRALTAALTAAFASTGSECSRLSDLRKYRCRVSARSRQSGCST